MNKRDTFYITTPIYYVNDVPHIGKPTATASRRSSQTSGNG